MDVNDSPTYIVADCAIVAEEVKLAAQRTGQAAVAVDRPHPALLGTATQPGKENTPAATNIVPTKHMTKAELKRLQWEKERSKILTIIFVKLYRIVVF